MTELYIYIPGPPVGWQRTGGSGVNRFNQPKTRAKEREIAQYAKLAMAGRKMFDGALRVEVIAWMPVPESWSKIKKDRARAGQIHPTGKPDSDNLGKLCLDALNKVVWKDDAAVVDLRISKRYGTPVQTVIIVERAGSAAHAKVAA